jgi:hypothetical protein
MGFPSDKPIQLTERQTELLTRAMAEAVQEAAIPKASETDVIKKPAPAPPVHPAAKPPQKTTII